MDTAENKNKEILESEEVSSSLGGSVSRLVEEDFQHATLGQELESGKDPFFRNKIKQRISSLKETKVKSKLEIKNVLSDANNVVVYRSFRAEWLQILLFCLSFFVISMLAYVFPGTLIKVSVGRIFGTDVGFIIPVLILIPIFIALKSVYNVFNTRYVLGMTSIIKIDGVLSPSSTSTELYYSNVRAMKIERGLVQRVLGVGSLIIGDLFSGDADINMNGVSNPVQYKSIVERRLRMLEKRKEEVPSFE